MKYFNRNNEVCPMYCMVCRSCWGPDLFRLSAVNHWAEGKQQVGLLSAFLLCMKYMENDGIHYWGCWEVEKQPWESTPAQQDCGNLWKLNTSATAVLEIKSQNKEQNVFEVTRTVLCHISVGRRCYWALQISAHGCSHAVLRETDSTFVVLQP